MIAQIREKSQHLPSSVPEGTAIEPLALFSGDATLAIGECSEPWERVNGILHDAFGYDASVDDIVKIIRRGPYGILPFTIWVETCIRVVKIDGILVESRLERILEAVTRL